MANSIEQEEKSKISILKIDEYWSKSNKEWADEDRKDRLENLKIRGKMRVLTFKSLRNTVKKKVEELALSSLTSINTEEAIDSLFNATLCLELAEKEYEVQKRTFTTLFGESVEE